MLCQSKTEVFFHRTTVHARYWTMKTLKNILFNRDFKKHENSHEITIISPRWPDDWKIEVTAGNKRQACSSNLLSNDRISHDFNSYVNIDTVLQHPQDIQKEFTIIASVLKSTRESTNKISRTNQIELMESKLQKLVLKI